MNTVPNVFRLYCRQPYGTFYILDVRTGKPESRMRAVNPMVPTPV